MAAGIILATNRAATVRERGAKATFAGVFLPPLPQGRGSVDSDQLLRFSGREQGQELFESSDELFAFDDCVVVIAGKFAK